MLDIFPSPFQHAKDAGKRVVGAGSQKRSPDAVGRTVDAVTHGGFQLVKEIARIPIDFALVPGAKLTRNAVASTVKGVIGATGSILGSLPVIPVMDGSSSLASAHDVRFGRASILPRPALSQLSGPRDPRSGQGQAAGNPDPQPGIA